MQKSKNAFTMIELVFVIVVLGILAAVALPKFAATRNDAVLAKAKADVSAIRSSIVTERQSRLIKGDSTWITKLSNGGNLFTGSDSNHTLLSYGITPGEWAHGAVTASTDTYTFTTGGSVYTFVYSNSNAAAANRGTFKCTGVTGTGNCSDITD